MQTPLVHVTRVVRKGCVFLSDYFDEWSLYLCRSSTASSSFFLGSPRSLCGAKTKAQRAVDGGGSEGRGGDGLLAVLQGGAPVGGGERGEGRRPPHRGQRPEGGLL